MSNRIGIGIDVFSGPGIDADATTIYNRIIADGGVSDLTRLNFFVKGLKTIYGSLTNVPVCYDAHWIGYKLGSGTGATAGQAAAKLYSLTVAGDAVQTTAASQPLLLSHNGASSDNYWYGSGVNGNFVSTPNAVANQITGDIDIKSTAKYIFNGSYAMIAAKWGAAQSFRFYITPSNYLILELGGIAGAQSSLVITSAMNHLRVTRNTTNGNILFYYSNDAITTDINSVTWIQLGTTISGTIGAFTASTNNVTIGQEQSNAFQGKIYRATIANSIGGTPVVDFNPATYNASTSQTAWTSATGEVWTINTGTATTGYKGVLVDRTLVQGDGVDDTLLSSTLNTAQPRTNYSSVRAYITGADTLFSDGNNFPPYQNLLRQYSGGTLEINSDGSVSMASSSLINKLVTSIINSTTSTIRVNNGTVTTSSITGATLVAIRLFRSGLGQFGMSSLNTYIISNSADNNTNQTATYNLIRSLNNNAF